MKITTVDVDPGTAEKWLAHNSHNRHSRSLTVAQWARDMRNGEWTNDTDPIRFHGYFDDDPKAAAECGQKGCSGLHPVLLNGQHRLASLISARVTLPFILIEGLDMADQHEMDTGNKRTFKDQLRLEGHADAATLAGVIRLSYLYDKGELRKREVTPSHTALRRFMDQHPELPEVLGPANKLYRAIGGRTSVFGTARWVLTNLDTHADVAEDVDVWWDQLVYGESLEQGDPALALRNFFIAQSRGGGVTDRRRRFGQVYSLALFFKAWNAWRDESPVKTLIWRNTAQRPEPFPIPY